ncbi:MAG: hypothetical protein WC378_14555 [Opitutaceae bacterium]|jgi:general secretion pathway protein K
MHKASNRDPGLQASGTPSRRRGSILVVVLVTLLFATLALTMFIEKAGDDLLVESREADARRLRREAYSSLETVLSVLQEFKLANGSLKSPAEGWDDPLGWSGYDPGSGRTVKVEFKDESGKLSLPRCTQATLVNLFKSWEISQSDSERLADALLYWMKHDTVPSSGYTPTYDMDLMQCEPPGRSLRSWGELAAIDVVRDAFFDEDGRPNSFWKRFVESVSLLDFAQSNVNAASAGALAAFGFDASQQGRLADYIAGRGSYRSQGPGYFKSSSDVAAVAGSEIPGAGFGTEIRALRIIVTVQEGRASFRLNAVVSFAGSGGAKIVDTKATPEKPRDNAKSDSSDSKKSAAAASAASSKKSSSGDAPSINYPFTVLELRENDENSQAPIDPLADKS